MTEIVLDQFDAEMNRGFLQVLVMVVLEKAMYGYMMLKTFESLGYTVEEPTLYPLLRRLETRGFIKSKWELSGGRPKKFYIITAKGKDARRALLEIWRRQIDILNTLLKEIDHV